MKLKAIIGIVLTLLTLAFNVALVASIGLNLVQNPGFEDEMAFWYVSMGTATYVADSSNPRSGTYCAKGIEVYEGSLGRLYQDMTALVSPSGQYKISGWIKTQDVVGYVVIALNYVNDYGVTPADGYVKEIGYVTGTADWTYYESDVFTLPPMPSDASAIWFLFDFNAGKGTAWWDEVSLIEIAPAVVPAIVDIDPNTLNLKSKGKWITAYIELPEGYDISDITVSTILLNDTVPAEWSDIQNDVLMVKFNRADVISLLGVGNQTIKITGELTDGTPFEGTDMIRTINLFSTKF